MSVINGTSGADSLTGTSGNDTINGLAGDDTLYGGSGGNDALYGGDGSDSLYTYGGVDTIDGGAGSNAWTGDYHASTSGLTLNQSAAGSWSLSNGTAATNIRNVTLTTGSGNDTFNFSVLSFSVPFAFSTFDGGGGTNTANYNLGSSSGVVSFSYTGSGQSGKGYGGVGLRSTFSDVSFQNMQTVTIVAGSADDFFSVAPVPGDHVTIDGGLGKDMVQLDLSGDNSAINFVLNNSPGSTTTFSGYGTISLKDVESLYLFGGSGNDTLSGGNGGNLIDGGAGTNVLTGGTGDDIFVSHGGADTVYGGAGNDGWRGDYGASSANLTFNQTGVGSYTLSNGATLSGIENIVLTLGAGGDVVNLKELASGQLNGGGGSNTLNLDWSPDTGADTVYGGTPGGAVYGGNHSVSYSQFSIVNITTGSGNDEFHIISGPSGRFHDNGGAGADTAFVDLSADTAAISFTLNTAANAVSTFVGAGSSLENFETVSVITGSGSDTLMGAGGNDTLDGGTGNNALYGGAGDDRLVSHGGVDTIDGGAGVDIWTGLFNSSSNLTFGPTAGGSWTASNGTHLSNVEAVAVATGPGNDTLTGGAGNDTLDGGSGNNALYGGGGNDILTSNGGVDTVDGGAGSNSWTGFYGSLSSVTLNQTGASSWTLSNGTHLTNIQNVELWGTNGVDTFNFNTLGGNYSVDGGDWDNNKVNMNFSGDANAITLDYGDSYGGYLKDATGRQVDFSRIEAVSLVSGAGNDSFAVHGGKVVQIDGGAGTDTLILDGAKSGYTVKADGSGGFNVTSSFIITTIHLVNVEKIQFADATVTLISTPPINGTSGPDHLNGTTADDTINGLAGDDTLSGLGGNDALYGGDGNDVLGGGAGNDTLDGGTGTNTATYTDATSAVTVSLAVSGAQSTVGAGLDTLVNIQNLTGSNYNDALTGSIGNNVLSGGAGDDTLTGGQGADTLTGGAGTDQFVLKSTADSTVATTGQDTVTDFSHAQGDKIVLSGIDANTGVAGDQAFTLVSSFTHAAGQLIEVAKPGGYLVEGDVNGDGTADFAIMVDTTTALVASDFLL